MDSLNFIIAKTKIIMGTNILHLVINLYLLNVPCILCLVVSLFTVIITNLDFMTYPTKMIIEVSILVMAVFIKVAIHMPKMMWAFKEGIFIELVKMVTIIVMSISVELYMEKELSIKVVVLVKYYIIAMEDWLVIEVVLPVGKFIIFEIHSMIWVLLKVKSVIMGLKLDFMDTDSEDSMED